MKGFNSLNPGRTHQLRVHRREIGHPIIGCDLYAATIDGVNSHQIAPSLMLRASNLAFEHPVTGAGLCMDSTNSNNSKAITGQTTVKSKGDQF